MTSVELTNRIKTWSTIYQLISFVVLFVVVKNLYQSGTVKKQNEVAFPVSVQNNRYTDVKR